MTTTRRRAFVTVFTFAALAVATNAQAVTTVTDSFSNPPLNPALVDADSAFTIAGGNIHRTSETGSSDRHYVATVESDFLLQDFTYGLTFTVPNVGETNIVFFGIGQGVPDTALFNEPQNYVGLRIQSAETNGNIDLAINATGNANDNAGVVQQALGVIDAGNANDTDRAVLEGLDGQLTFMVDLGYNGVFVPDVTFVVPDVLTAAPFLNGGDTSLFFGTASPDNQFTDLSITPVPEPSSAVLFVLGGLTLGGIARLRRSVDA